MDSTSNESSYDSSPNPARSQSRQARRDRWKQKRRRQSRSRARSDYRSISPQSKDTAHVRSRAERMDKDHNEIPDYNQDPIFPILRKKRYKIQSFWKSQRRHFLEEKCTQSMPNSLRRKAQGCYPLPKGAGNQDTSTGCIYKVRDPTPGQVCRYRPGKGPDICRGCFSTFSVYLGA